MWKLFNTKKEHIEQYIVVGEEIVVGRKDAALMITNDPSVSRKHAVLILKHPEENVGNPSKPSSLFLRDEGSKYGTFKNGVRLTSEVELFNNDIVKFGQMESEFRVCKIPLVITTSCLDISRKRELKRTVHSLGGHFISEWQPCCSHLVMSEVKVTIKALCCLCSAKPIVKPEYFSDLKDSITNSTSIPQPNQYIPPIGEALIDKEKVSFDIDLHRKSLFKGKTFLFLDEKQFKKLHLGIVLGGGTASILSSKEIASDLLLRKGVCIIDPVKESSQDKDNILQKILSILQPKKLRMIPESDVGLAVAYCSIEKFCNPEFNLGEVVLLNHKLESQTLTEREVYVPDTQERITSVDRNKIAASEPCNSLHFSTFQADPAEDMDISEIPLSAQVKRELADIFDEPEDFKADSFPKVSAKPSIVDSMDVTRKLKRETPYRNAKLTEEPSNVDNSMEVTRKLKRETTYRNAKLIEEPSNVDDSMEVTRKLKRESSFRSTNGECSYSHQDEETSTKKRKLSRTETNQTTLKQNGFLKKENMSHSKNIKSENNISDEDDAVNIAASRKGRENIKSENGDISGVNGYIEPELPRNLMKVEIVSLICKKKSIVPEVNENRNSNVKNFKKFKKVLPKKSRALPRIIGAHELIAYDKVAAQICNEVWDDPAEEAPQPVRGAFDWDTPTV